MTLAFDLARQRTADRVIRRRGGRCLLRRDGLADRECFACLVDYTVNERRNELIKSKDRYALISAKGLTMPPSSEMGDRLVTFEEDGVTEDEVYSIVDEDTLKPARTPIYYECQLRPTE